VRRLLIVLLVGCYNPSPPTGAPCASDEECPTGLVCRDQRCDTANGSTGDATIPNDDATSIDAVPIDGCSTFSTQLDTCALGPSMSFDLVVDAQYDTGTHQLTDADGDTQMPPHVVVTGPAGPMDVLVASEFSIAGGRTLRVTGPIPFGIVATGPILIAGTIDASNGGAGARSRAACGSASGRNALDDLTGAPGAGGGAFQGDGGDGAQGDANGGPTPGAVGGIAVSLPPGPLGGCPGGAGGIGDPNTAGSAGSGGGAVYLVSASSITISSTGRINVGGGGGGRGLTIDGSGGGGGSGGMILVECPSVNVAGVLAANGGGGGGGADESASGTSGASGGASATAAAGGLGGSDDGGPGGAGGAGANRNGVNAAGTPDGAGGGGGGGVGFTASVSPPNVTGTVSPALTPWP
jgi:hypothetical protein